MTLAGCQIVSGLDSLDVPQNGHPTGSGSGSGGAVSCTDGAVNGNETDTDCGGLDCPPCSAGKSCEGPSDCVSSVCGGIGVCSCGVEHLVIGEIRTRGIGGGNDDFVELYNPSAFSILLTTTTTLESRAADSGSPTVRWSGAGRSYVPPGGHVLLTGTGYLQDGVLGDGALSSSIADEASVALKDNGVVVDAVCFYCGVNPFTPDFDCEGEPVLRTGCDTSISSVERREGGLAGSCVDSDDNNADFLIRPAADPQDLASPLTP